MFHLEELFRHYVMKEKSQKSQVPSQKSISDFLFAIAHWVRLYLLTYRINNPLII